MNLRSFGCSFTAGTDLIDKNNVWSNIIADRLGVLHMNHAGAGIGNLCIAESVMQHATANDVCVINWTWIDRFDFVDPLSETWKSILPVDVNNYSKIYYRYLHSQYRDMLTSLLQAATVIDYLKSKNINFIMTIIDDLWMARVHRGWHDPLAVTWLQNKLRPYLHDFEGMNFLSWTRHHKFPISNTWHPLDEAHFAAADLMQPVIASILHRA
jgi:hypothetical protein